MKNSFLILILFISCNLFAQAQLQNKEFRAIWVITWEYISGSSSVEENKARIREILDNHQKANMTSVLFQVRQGGTAYYNSSFEPWGSYAGASYPGFDPLSYAIEEAHKSVLLCHLGNIAQKFERSLETDTSNGRIVNDNEAMKLWSREYEKGWEPAI